MAKINLKLIRSHSLKGLAEGWDDCYIRVECSSTSEITEWRKQGLLDLTGEESFEQLRKVLRQKIKGGQVIDTKPDGTTEPRNFGAEDVDDVIAALPNVTLQEVFQTSLGLAQLN